MTKAASIDRICFICNYNLYESKRHFTKEFAEALERKGVETLIIDAAERAIDHSTMKRILDFKPTLTCSFNSILPQTNGRYFWDDLAIPHWSILVDPAIYSMGLVQSSYALVSCVDKGDCQALYSATSKQAIFFPHSVDRNLNDKGMKEKTYDVVFIGSCYDYEFLRTSWQNQYPSEICQVLDKAIEMVLSDSKTSIAEALAAAWNQYLLSPLEIDFFTLFHFVDYFTRGKERVELIRAIKDVPVHIFGDTSNETGPESRGWNYYLADCKNVILHPPILFAQSLEILAKSKIALNSMPFFKNGTHERIFTALGSGALPITASSHFWKNHFVNGNDIVLYQPKQWHQANELVNRYLADEGLRNEVVSKGALKVQQEYTWDCRASQVIYQLPMLLKGITHVA